MRDVFVGRGNELGVLDAALADVVGGRGRLVLLAGEPGIGKSRLADEFATGAMTGGAVIAWGRCWELGGAPAYWPWTEALRGIIAQRSAVGAEQLGQLLPELAGPTVEVAAEHAETARFRLFEAVVQYLRMASAEHPLVVVLEDLHAADEPSLLLLQYVSRAVAGCRVLVVATYRDVEVVADSVVTAALSELMRDRATTRIVLSGLSTADVGEMIAATTGAATTPDVVERVRSHTEGNPLYVREVARLLTTEGSLPEIGGRLAVPRDVREIVLSRTRRLPDDCRDVLTLAAVVGRDFPIDLMTRLRGADVVEQLEPAVQAGLVIEGAPGELRFSHAVVSEALYDATPPSQRLQLHYEVAETMERHHASIASHRASIAHHYLLALPVAPAEKAVAAARGAAEAAVARLAYEEGVRLYRGAIEASRVLDDERQYVELLLALGDALSRAGGTEDSKAAFLEATNRLRAMDDPQLFGEAALGYGGSFVWLRAGDDTRIVPLLQEAIDRLAGTESPLRVRLLVRLSGALRDEVAKAPRDALSGEALEAARRINDPTLLAYVLPGRWTAIWGPERADELRELAAEAVANADRSRERDRRGDALMVSTLTDLMFGDIDRARESLSRYMAVGDELSRPSFQWYGVVVDAVLQLSDGRLTQAEDSIERARLMGRQVQAWDAEVSYCLALAMLRWEQGRLAEVEALVHDATTRFPGYRVFRCLDAVCNLEAGRTEEATALVRAILAAGEDALPLNNDWLAGTTLLAEIAHRLSLTDIAPPLYDSMQPFSHLVGNAGGEPFTGSMHRPLGQMAELQGDLERALVHQEQALEVHTRMRSELWTAHSEFDLAEVLRARKRPDDAERATHLYARALHRCETLGMTALAVRIRAVLATDRSAGNRPGGLTKRELEVAALVAAGASNRDIADDLVISERTAESHVQNILTKLGFGSRAQIATWATTEGLSTGT